MPSSTVDKRNPAPVDRSFIPSCTGSYVYITGTGFLPSKICLDIVESNYIPTP